MPRWAWVALALVLGLVGYLAFRHDRAGQHPSEIVSNRPLLLNRAAATLRSDPNIGDVVYNGAGDQWNVTPAAADADPHAFGRYVCFVLEQGGVVAPHTNVRVIDGAALEANGFDYAAAGRDVVICGEK